ncbi:Alcohol dehydrogenase-like 7 [Linum perenne]
MYCFISSANLILFQIFCVLKKDSTWNHTQAYLQFCPLPDPCYLSPPFLYELPPTSPVTKQTNSQIEKKKEKKNKKPQIMDSQKPSTVGKPIRCKAAVCRVAGEPLVMEEITVATPRAHEARIRIVCTSLCHSDITFWKMKEFPGITPRILGHEAIGIVESVGEKVIKLEVGDTVIPVFLSDCAECSDCRSKKSNLCTKFPFQISPWMPRDGTSRFTDLDGNIIHHFLSVSSFSEYTVVDVAHLTKIDATVPMNIACLLSCGVSTGVGAAWRTADVEEGSTVAIFGLGSIGLAVAEGARIRGAGRIIGVDMKPDKFEIGKEFGITEFVNPADCGDKSLSQVINEITAGGADYCFECVGLPSLMEEAYACCRKGWGKTIVLGVARPMSEIKLQCFEVLHSGKILTGSLFGGLKPKSDIPILLKHYMNKELELDKFVTHEMDFKDINTAFDLLIKGESLRCVMWMNR